MNDIQNTHKKTNVNFNTLRVLTFRIRSVCDLSLTHTPAACFTFLPFNYAHKPVCSSVIRQNPRVRFTQPRPKVQKMQEVQQVHFLHHATYEGIHPEILHKNRAGRTLTFRVCNFVRRLINVNRSWNGRCCLYTDYSIKFKSLINVTLHHIRLVILMSWKEEI